MKKLPLIMVAPNGARRTKSDHQAIPVTLLELVETGRACFEAGAGAMHAHVRDEAQQHVLDAGLYRELITEMRLHVPELAVQITTEAVGRYSSAQQRKLVRDVEPEAVSVSMVEMLSDGNEKEARAFYKWCAQAEVCVQHILYSSQELLKFITLAKGGFFSTETPQLLFVLGRYAKNQESDPEMLDPFLQTLEARGFASDWAVCAFGEAETSCALKAIELGGKCRVGFENSLWNSNGQLAGNNAERVAEINSLVNICELNL
ncbi:MAG: 3-keto-5-aminohexanoate cleavage protein [Salaquimonas sp.]